MGLGLLEKDIKVTRFFFHVWPHGFLPCARRLPDHFAPLALLCELRRQDVDWFENGHRLDDGGGF